jgi:hypothetical protein
MQDIEADEVSLLKIVEVKGSSLHREWRPEMSIC